MAQYDPPSDADMVDQSIVRTEMDRVRIEMDRHRLYRADPTERAEFGKAIDLLYEALRTEDKRDKFRELLKFLSDPEIKLDLDELRELRERREKREKRLAKFFKFGAWIVPISIPAVTWVYDHWASVLAFFSRVGGGRQ